MHPAQTQAAINSATSGVAIITVPMFGLLVYEVWVRGVLACQALSEHGARNCARNYIRKLATKGD